jgi:hypothetical protein
MKELIPKKEINIVVFAYVRPILLQQCLDSLNKSLLSERANLIVCIDGLKNNVSDSTKISHAKTIRIASKENRFLSTTVLVNKENYGVGRQYFDKIDTLLEKYDELVVVEDDVVVGKYFLQYMVDSFSRFGNSPNVAMIVGYVYYIPFFKKTNSCYFNKGGGNQAFGITKLFWSKIDRTCNGYEQLKWDKKLKAKFNSSGYDYAKMLIDEIENNRQDAWDVIFYWNAFKKQLFCLSPDYSMASNIGWGSVGSTHTFIDNPFEQSVFDDNYPILNFPDSVVEDKKRGFQRRFYMKYVIRFKFYRIRIKKLYKRFFVPQ